MPDRPAFDVVEPSSRESPVIVEVPHAGLALDAQALAYTVAPARSIAADADLFVDELFQDAPSLGASMIVARISRYVVDLNRGEQDVDAEAAEGGGPAPWPRGLVWRLTTDGDPVLSSRLPRRELERRLERYYRPYHATLRALIERKRARFGRALLVCAHSMPSQGRRGHADPAGLRADLVPGTRGRTSCGERVIALVDELGHAQGWSIRHDDPYRGGFSTGHYGKPADNVHAIQLEISRRIYMDESTFELRPAGVAAVRQFVRALVARLPSVS